MKKIQVIETETGHVEHQIDVSDKSERQIEKVEDGLNINLNHEVYHTLIVSE